MAGTVRVEGLRDLQRAFKAADASLQRELRGRLREVGEPVRADAEALAVSGIRRVGMEWSRMRLGVTTTSVYVAPRARGRGQWRRRPNLALLLLERSMIPALDRNTPRVLREMDLLLAEVGRVWERA